MKELKFDKDKVPKVEESKKEIPKRKYTAKKFAHEQGVHRRKQIKDCNLCNGTPPLSTKVMSGFEYERCDICFEILNYKKV